MRITTISEFVTFDYSTLSLSNNAFFSAFLSPFVPILAVSLYLLLSRPICTYISKALNLKPKGVTLQTLTILHSSLLALYSAWTCFHALKLVGRAVLQQGGGLYPTLCGSYEDIWVKRGLGFWIFHFYLSKYYEFVDTWIILLKQRDPSFLQTFHHAGIVILMWGFVVTGNTAPALVVLCFNSFIHTLMYSYYVMAALNIKSFLKPYMTSMQIVQFIVGLGITFQTHFISGCLNEAQNFVLICMEIYTVALVLLFGIFFMESYLRGKKDIGKLKAGDKKKAI